MSDPDALTALAFAHVDAGQFHSSAQRSRGKQTLTTARLLSRLRRTNGAFLALHRLVTILAKISHSTH